MIYVRLLRVLQGLSVPVVLIWWQRLFVCLFGSLIYVCVLEVCV